MEMNDSKKRKTESKQKKIEGDKQFEEGKDGESRENKRGGSEEQ